MQTNTHSSNKPIFLGNSWFSNVPTVVNLKNRLDSHFIGVVNVGHKRCPKKWIESTMSDWPSDTYIVLELEEIDR